MQVERALPGQKAHPHPLQGRKCGLPLLPGMLILVSLLLYNIPQGTWGKKLHPGSAWAVLSFQGQDFLQQGSTFPELPPSAPTMLNKCICFLQILGSALNQSYMEMRRSGMPLCNPMVSHPDRAQLQVICSPLNHIF